MTKTAAPVLDEANRHRILSLYQIASSRNPAGIFWRSSTVGIPHKDKSLWFSAEVYIRFTYRGIVRFRTIRRFQGKNLDVVREKTVAFHTQAQDYLLELGRQWPRHLPIPAPVEV